MEKERKRKKREEHELSRYSPSAESESIPRRRRPTRVPNMSLRSMHSAVSVIVVQSLPRFCKSDSERNGDGEKTRSRKNILPNATFPPIYFERERERESSPDFHRRESRREGRETARAIFISRRREMETPSGISSLAHASRVSTAREAALGKGKATLSLSLSLVWRKISNFRISSRSRNGKKRDGYRSFDTGRRGIGEEKREKRNFSNR